MAGADVSRDEIIQLLSQLISLKSVNPRDMVNPGPDDGELHMAEFIAKWGKDLGLAVEVHEVLPNRPNVIVKLEGRDPEKIILLEGHMDTVQVDGMVIDPFMAKTAGDRIYGRGACDAKGSLASMMLALKTIASSPEKIDASVALAAVVDEEHKFRGVQALIDSGMKASAAIVGEPTGLDLVIAHKGCARWWITAHGRAAHSSQPQEGINAIYKMSHVIKAIEGLGRAYMARSHPLVGPPLITVTLVKGGSGINTVPDRCAINIDRRTLPGENADDVIGEVLALLEDLKRKDPELEVEMEPPYLFDPPMEISRDEPIVGALEKAIIRLGRSPRITGAPYGTDASKLVRAGIPSVVFGPGSIANAHAADEYISISEIEAAVRILVEAIANF